MKEADSLARAGYSVSVISARYSRWGIDSDPSCTSSCWRWIVALPFGPLAPFLTRLRQTFTFQFARFLWQLGFRHSSVAVAAWHPLCLDLITAARACKADLYIAHYPAALPAAASAAQKYHSRYAFDAEDFHLGDPPEHCSFRIQRALTRSIESRWLPGACFITAASAGIAEAYASTYGLQLPTVVRNVFPLSQAPSEATLQGSVFPRPTLYWFSQTIGPDRGLECAVRALPLARSKPHLHMRGIITPLYREKLVMLARQLGVEQHLHFHPPAPPEEMERLASVYDVGLAAETGCTPNRRIALTNKLFSFALAGIPILLSDIPAHIQVQAEAGDAVRLFRREDPASLAAALDGLLDGPCAPLADARAAAYRLGQERWNWEREQERLLDRVFALLPTSDRLHSPAGALVS